MNAQVRTIVGIVLMALAASSADADDTGAAPSDLRSGDRVKARLQGEDKTLRGAIERVTTDELVVRAPGGGAPFRLRFSQLQSLEVARGTRSQWRKGAAIGFVPGAVFVGWASGVVACGDLNGCYFQKGWAVVGGLIGGAVTGSLGALVGLAFKTDRWVSVSERKPKVALVFTPAPGQTKVALSVTF